MLLKVKIFGVLDLKSETFFEPCLRTAITTPALPTLVLRVSVQVVGQLPGIGSKVEQGGWMGVMVAIYPQVVGTIKDLMEVITAKDITQVICWVEYEAMMNRVRMI